MVYFLNIKGKTHAEDTLHSLFDENKGKIVILGFSMELRRSPPGERQCSIFFTQYFQFKYFCYPLCHQLSIVTPGICQSSAIS